MQKYKTNLVLFFIQHEIVNKTFMKVKDRYEAVF
jgi:hypothetical protein